MYETFVASLDARELNARVVRSQFEPVMAGVAAILLDRGMDSESAARLMGEKFPDYSIDWQGGI
jgi:hypothetical protein